MELEEQTLEHAGDRCEECGAKLTPQELAQVIERDRLAVATAQPVELEDRALRTGQAGSPTQYSTAPAMRPSCRS